MSPWLLATPLAVAVAAAVFFWRRTLTLQESLDAFAGYNAQNIQELQVAVAAMPEKIAQAKRQAVADYIAANPDPTGPVTIDGVTYESLAAFLQTITDQSKTVIANTGAIGIHLDDAIQPAAPAA